MTVEPLVAPQAPEPQRVEQARAVANSGCSRELPAWVQSSRHEDPEWVTTRDDADERMAEQVAEALLASLPPGGDLQDGSSSRPTVEVPQAFRPREGRPLPDVVRRWAQPRADRDLSRVRVHDTPSSQRQADELRARAYTVGRDIVLGSAVGRMESAFADPAGRHTIAHEIGHVVAPPRSGKVGRDEPTDDKPVDTTVRWTRYEPPADVQRVIDEVPAYVENLSRIEWDKRALELFGQEEVDNETPADVLKPELITIVCDNYVIMLSSEGSVVSVEPQEADTKIPKGDGLRVVLTYPVLGVAWTFGVSTRAADNSEAMELKPSAKKAPIPDSKPGQSFLFVFLPGVTAPNELIEKLKKPKVKVNTNDTPGWTKDQLAKLKKVKAQKATQEPATPPPGSKEGAEKGEGKGDTGEGKGAGHGTGDGVGDGDSTGEPGPGGEKGEEKKEEPLKGPVKYDTWQGEKGPPQLVMEIDRAWTSIPLKEGESPEALEARADAALAALQASRDPANSVKVERGVSETGFVQAKGSTEGVAQTKAQAEAQAKSTATHRTPGEMVTPGKGGIANAPPYPSKISMTGRDERFPAVTTSGATNEFLMNLDYAAMSLGFQDEVFNRLQNVQFYWEVIDVSGLTVAKAKEMSGDGADNKLQQEAEKLAQQTAIGKGRAESGTGAVGTNLDRDLDAIAEDQANDIKMMADEDWPWEARAAYLGVIGISNVIRTIGSVVGSFIDILAQPLNARSIGFDHNGDYIVRCVATPLVSDDAREDPDHHVIRKSSISVLPIRVSNVNDRAVEGLNRDDETIAAKEAKLKQEQDKVAKEEGSQSAVEQAQGEVDALMKARGRSATEELGFRVDYLRDQVRVAHALIERRTSPAPPTPAGEKPKPYAAWKEDEVALAIRLLGMNKTVHVYLKEMKEALEQSTKSDHEGWVKAHTNFEPVGAAKRAEFRPRMVLASEVNGQVTDVLCALGQVSKGDSAPWRWKLVDVTSPSSRDEYVGTSAKAGEEGRAAAIRDCFRQFAEKSGYGRGTLAIRLPDDLRAAVPAASVEPTMRSAPGGGDRGLARLGDLAKATMIAGLFVAGPAGLVIGAMGGVAGAIVAVNSLVKRARTGHMLEIGTIFDVLGVIGGAVSFLNAGVALVRGSAKFGEALAKAPKWLERLEKVENVLHVYGKFDNVQQIVSIPVQLAVEWNEIEESGASDSEKRARKMKALLHALETGAITVAMMGGGFGKKEGDVVTPTTDSEAPLPKGTGEADAHARADGTGPPRPPTVHPDDGAGASQAEGSAPKKGPVTVDAAKEMAKARAEATAQAERKAAHDETAKPKGEEKVTPEGDERTTVGTPKGPSTGKFEPIPDRNAAEKQKVVETLQARLGKEVPTPTSSGKKAPQGEYGAPTTSSSEAVANYDKAVAESAGREVGLFFNPNTGEFQVMVGTENSVRGPKGDGWQALVHLHPNPENVITFRLPAPADVWGAVKAALRTGSHTEFVQSTRPDGSSGLSKVTVTTPPLKITVELPASPGEPARTITARTPDEYLGEYSRDATYMEPGSKLYDWVMKDLDDYYNLKRKDSDERTAAGVAGKPSQTTPGGGSGAKGKHAKAIEALKDDVRKRQEKADPASKEVSDELLADLDKLAADDSLGASPDEVGRAIKAHQDDLAGSYDGGRPVPLSKIESKAQRMRTEASKTKKEELKAALDRLAGEFDKLAEKVKKDPSLDPRPEFARLQKEWANLEAKESEVFFYLAGDPVLRRDIIEWFTTNGAKTLDDPMGQLVMERWLRHLKNSDDLALGQSPRGTAQSLSLESDLQGAVKAAVNAGRYPDWYISEFNEGVAEGEKHGRTDGWPTDGAGKAWEVDHVVELWLGGADTVSNFLAIPKRTHNDKNALMGKFRREFRGRSDAGDSVDVRATDPKETK